MSRRLTVDDADRFVIWCALTSDAAPTLWGGPDDGKSTRLQIHRGRTGWVASAWTRTKSYAVTRWLTADGTWSTDPDDAGCTGAGPQAVLDAAIAAGAVLV